MYGLAQLLAVVSPDMFDTFEIETSMPLFRRFGLVYYGCCDPLDKKMNKVRKIPNLRKISMSPWVDEEIDASEICFELILKDISTVKYEPKRLWRWAEIAMDIVGA